jgi:hypothetical protein
VVLRTHAHNRSGEQLGDFSVRVSGLDFVR